MEIILYEVDESFSEVLFEEIHAEAIRLQKIFNFFDDNSELSKLNRERKKKISKDLLIVISESTKYCEMTSGKYDVSKGKEIKSRKEGKNFENVTCSYKDIKIKENTIKLTHKDVLIDLGSIAKGYIVDKLIEFIYDKGITSCFIDARGDMRVSGEQLEVIEIQNPRDKNSAFNSIILENKSIATSGDYNQFYGNYENCHIVGKKDLISVTVIADSLMEADVIATCLFLLGKEDSKKFLLIKKNVSALLIDKTFKISKHNNFEKYGLPGEKHEN